MKISEILQKEYPNIQDTFISGRDARKWDGQMITPLICLVVLI